MKLKTRYAYEKRIKELEEENEKLKVRLNVYWLTCLKIYDWLIPFAEKNSGSPNAEYGLKFFREFIFNYKTP